jgi:hypothetical protein
VSTTNRTDLYWGARAAQATEAAEEATNPLVKEVLAKVAAASAAIAAEFASAPIAEHDGEGR